MSINVLADPEAMGAAAGTMAVETLRAALAAKPRVTLVLACAPSQFHTLATILRAPGLAWDRVDFFHLDEYIGLGPDHPASFRRVLNERFLSKLPTKPAFNGIDGKAADPAAECKRLGELIRKHPIDLALIGIGENSHVAFNDPPADLTTREPYLLVDLDEACRRQQFTEGWFPSMEAVPKKAISMSPRHIMSAKRLINSVPDARKAQAIHDSVEGPITEMVPASILRMHNDYHLFIDRAAASKLKYL